MATAREEEEGQGPRARVSSTQRLVAHRRIGLGPYFWWVLAAGLIRWLPLQVV
jgi:hypothetical protein